MSHKEAQVQTGEIPLLIGVLAGGQSARMGTDKATLVMQGETLLERAVRTAIATVNMVAVSGREKPDGWPYPQVEFIPDDIPNQGLLYGIFHLLERFRAPVLAIGCDMPLISTEALEWLIARVPDNMNADGLATEDSEHRIQPLFTVYTPDVLPLIERHFREGNRSPRSVIEEGRFGRLTLPPSIEEVVLSVDTHEAFERIVSMLEDRR